MNTVRADVLAAQLLRQGQPVSQVVDATGLEPKEVMAIAQKLKLKAVGGPDLLPKEMKVDRDLEALMIALSRQSQAARYPKKAQRQLAKAADYVAAALVAIAEDEGKAEKRAELARLEDEVKRLRAEIRGTTATSAPKRNWKAVREWARANGYEVADIGLPKKDVVAAYDQAVAS